MSGDGKAHAANSIHGIQVDAIAEGVRAALRRLRLPRRLRATLNEDDLVQEILLRLTCSHTFAIAAGEGDAAWRSYVHVVARRLGRDLLRHSGHRGRLRTAGFDEPSASPHCEDAPDMRADLRTRLLEWLRSLTTRRRRTLLDETVRPDDGVPDSPSRRRRRHRLRASLLAELEEEDTGGG
jgi:DNA-directed RNA polymerase specialized sigma24 family protein